MRGARQIAAAVAALSLLFLTGCGSSDDENPPVADSFYGVAPEGIQDSSDYTRMRNGGVGVVRIVIQWSGIEATEPGRYDWSSTDQLVGALADAGLEPIATVFGTPPIYAKEPTEAPTNDEKTLDAWTDFVAAAADRYGTDGAFWSEYSANHPDAEPQPIREWEIWNEPNSSTFWKPAPDPDAYASLLKRSAEAIGDVEPDARIMTAGMFATPQSEGAISSYDFLSELLADDDVADVVDVVGIHPYGPDVDAVTDQVEKTRRALDGDGVEVPMWVTEIGWGSNPKSGNDLSKTPEEQAQLLTDSFSALRDDDFGVEGVVWYTWHDATESAVGSCGWCASAGLVDADRDSKPAWIAYTDLTGGTP